MKSLMRRIEPIGLFGCVVARRKGAIFAPILAPNINPTPLNKMPRQSTARSFVFERTAAELRIEQRQETAKCLLVTAMRCRRQKEQVSARIFRNLPKQLKSLLTPEVGADTGVCLIHDHERRTCASEAVAPLFGLNVIQANDGEWVRLEESLRLCQSPFKPSGRGCCDCYSVKIKLAMQLASPLLNQMWRTQDGEPIYLSTIDELTQNEARLYGLTDTYVIRNHQPHRLLAEGHEQWNQLIGAGIKRNPCSRAEWSRPSAKRQAQCFA
jgi:hypothetical protein